MEECEVWKVIEGTEGKYQVSNLGRIKSLSRVTRNRLFPECILKPRLDPYGYEQVNLHLNKKTVSFKVHRLVAQAFIENPENKATVNHKNANKIDNTVENLEWNTFSENVKYAHRNGLYNSPKGEDSVRSTISNETAIEIKKRIGQGETAASIAEGLGLNCSLVAKIKSKQTWVHLGGGW